MSKVVIIHSYSIVDEDATASIKVSKIAPDIYVDSQIFNAFEISEYITSRKHIRNLPDTIDRFADEIMYMEAYIKTLHKSIHTLTLNKPFFKRLRYLFTGSI